MAFILDMMLGKYQLLDQKALSHMDVFFYMSLGAAIIQGDAQPCKFA